MNCRLCKKEVMFLSSTMEIFHSECRVLKESFSCDHCKVIVDIETRITTEAHWEEINAIFKRNTDEL